MSDARRRLPAVSTLLEYEGVRALHAAAPREVIADAVRRSIETARRDPAVGPDSETAWVAAVTAEVDRALERSLRPVINATGVVLHTNLGRAPVAARAIAAAQAVAFGYSNLEYDLAAGSRGSRHGHCARILCELTGAEDAFVLSQLDPAKNEVIVPTAQERQAFIDAAEPVIARHRGGFDPRILAWLS